MTSCSQAAHSPSSTRTISRRLAGTTSSSSRRTRHACGSGSRLSKCVPLFVFFSAILLTRGRQIPERMPPCPNGKCVCAWWVSLRYRSSTRLHKVFQAMARQQRHSQLLHECVAHPRMLPCFRLTSLFPQPASTALSPTLIPPLHDRSSHLSTPSSVPQTTRPARQRRARRDRSSRTTRLRTLSGKETTRDQAIMQAGRSR